MKRIIVSILASLCCLFVSACSRSAGSSGPKTLLVSFRFGILYPFAGYLLFGMIGGLLGVLVVLGMRRYLQKSPQ